MQGLWKDLENLITILGQFAKLRSYRLCSVTSVFLMATTLLPLIELSWNVIFENFSKISRGKSSSFEICHKFRVFYKIRNCIYHNIASVHFKVRTVSRKFWKNQEAHCKYIYIYIYIFLKPCHIWNNVKDTAERETSHRRKYNTEHGICIPD